MINNVARVFPLGAEAMQRPLPEMWRVRADQPFIPRLGKTALGALFKSESVRDFAFTPAGRVLVGKSEMLGRDMSKLLMATLLP